MSEVIQIHLLFYVIAAHSEFLLILHHQTQDWFHLTVFHSCFLNETFISSFRIQCYVFFFFLTHFLSDSSSFGFELSCSQFTMQFTQTRIYSVRIQSVRRLKKKFSCVLLIVTLCKRLSDGSGLSSWSCSSVSFFSSVLPVSFMHSNSDDLFLLLPSCKLSVLCNEVCKCFQLYVFDFPTEIPSVAYDVPIDSRRHLVSSHTYFGKTKNLAHNWTTCEPLT